MYYKLELFIREWKEDLVHPYEETFSADLHSYWKKAAQTLYLAQSKYGPDYKV
jgi:hypothetical protein